MASIKLKGDTSGEVTISAPSVAGTTTLELPATSSTLATQNSLGVRNLIINGDMRIDERNAGGAISAATLGGYGYMVDRWWFYGSQSSKFNAQQNQGSITPPDDFKNYLGMTVDSAYSIGASDQFIVATRLEGLNTAHLKWGTANAKTITISYYVRSSLTGTFNGYIRNSASNRSYPFTYTISSADTWEKKTATIAGDTTGTWLETNGTGIELGFNLGSGASSSGTANTWAAANYTGATGATSVVGTSGATFYITGVQLEVGTEATPFEHRPYDMELQRCQRYYYIIGGYCVGQNNTSTAILFSCVVPTVMRATPTVTLLASGWVNTNYFCLSNNVWVGNSSPTVTNPFYDGHTGININLNGFSGLSTGIATLNIPGKFIGLSAEL